MQNNNTLNNLQDLFGNTLRDFANNSIAAYKPFMDSMISNVGSISKTMLNTSYGGIQLPNLFKQTCNCCPPECDCPPQCIATISRCAMPGEKIIVPILVKNNCSQAKTYRAGIRELTDQDGKTAPAQPALNKESVTIAPGRSEQILLTLDLANFSDSATYTTEIVLREKDINQNICFTLKTSNDCHPVTATPQDEQQFKQHWQSWQSHYYCEPTTNQRGISTLSN